MTTLAPLTPSERTALRMIEAAADAGRACPTNGAIAERCGFGSVASSAKVVSQLQKGGWISITRFQSGREVTVVSTGRMTHWPHARTPHWREAAMAPAPRPREPRAPVAKSTDGEREPPAWRAPAALVRLDRDPCFNCGVRADLGCAHRPASVAEEIGA